MREASLLWLTLVTLLAAFSFPALLGMAEWQVRVSGLFLQLLGLSTVAWGLRETRRLFERPSVVTLFFSWLARFPRWRRSIVVIAGTATGLSIAGSARLRAWTPMNPDAPVDEQLRALRNNVDRLDQRLTNAESDVDKHRSHLQDAVRAEQEARSQGDKDLRARLEAAQTGGLHISLMGLVWLLFGLVMGTISGELARAAR
jgi:hypothetical protein